MADFRNELDDLQDHHTKAELIDVLAEKVGTRATSVNPVTQAIFDRIVPDHQPVEFARRAAGYSDDLKPVQKNATALKILLHEQVGRPLHDRVLNLTKRDFAECIVAVDAYESGYERGFNTHVPTTLPRSMDGFVSEVPARSKTPPSPFETGIELVGDFEDQLVQWADQQLSATDPAYFVYTLDCTPPIGGDENPKIRELRRAVKTHIVAGTDIEALHPGEQAAHALNQNNRIYYVGSTNDLVQRIQQHVTGTAESGVDFTTIMPPRSLVSVAGTRSRTEAETMEGEQAIKLNRRENLFAYSDEL